MVDRANESRTVYCGGFSYELSDDDLRAFFSAVGGVTGAKARPRDPSERRRRC